MRSVMSRWSGVLAGLASLLVLASHGWTLDSIRLANGEWPPYYSQSLEGYGVGSRIVTEAFALSGIRVDYEFYPWKRALALARSGTLDGVVGFDRNPERDRDFYFSDVVWTSRWVFFHLKTRVFSWDSLGDLRGLPVGGTLGYMYTQDFLDAERAKTITVFRAPSDYLGFKMLLGGNVFVFPQLREVGWYQLRTTFPAEDAARVTAHSRPLGMHEDYLLLSRKRPDAERLMLLFNEGLRALKASGRLDELLRGLPCGPDHS